MSPCRGELAQRAIRARIVAESNTNDVARNSRNAARADRNRGGAAEHNGFGLIAGGAHSHDHEGIAAVMYAPAGVHGSSSRSIRWARGTVAGF